MWWGLGRFLLPTHSRCHSCRQCKVCYDGRCFLNMNRTQEQWLTYWKESCHFLKSCWLRLWLMPQSQEGKQFSRGYHREVLTWKVRRKCMTSEGHCKGNLLGLKGYQNSHRQCHWGMLVGTWVSEETCIGAELCWEFWGCEKVPWTNLKRRQWWITLQLFFDFYICLSLQELVWYFDSYHAVWLILYFVLVCRIFRIRRSVNSWHDFQV